MIFFVPSTFLQQSLTVLQKLLQGSLKKHSEREKNTKPIQRSDMLLQRSSANMDFTQMGFYWFRALRFESQFYRLLVRREDAKGG